MISDWCQVHFNFFFWKAPLLPIVSSFHGKWKINILNRIWTFGCNCWITFDAQHQIHLPKMQTFLFISTQWNKFVENQHAIEATTLTKQFPLISSLPRIISLCSGTSTFSPKPYQQNLVYWSTRKKKRRIYTWWK